MVEQRWHADNQYGVNKMLEQLIEAHLGKLLLDLLKSRAECAALAATVTKLRDDAKAARTPPADG